MFTLSLQPRFAETDALGHINNTTIPIWFEQGRTPIFELFVPSLSVKEWNLILAKIDVEFLSETFYGKSVEIRTMVEKIGNSSLLILQQVWQDNVKTAEGRATMVHFDYSAKKARPIPDDLRNVLLKHTADDAPAS